MQVSTGPVTVSQLAIAPVKGMRLLSASEIQVSRHGVAGDREFLVVRGDGKLLLTTRTPALLGIEPAWDPSRGTLALRFPDGSVIEDTPEPGAPAVTSMYDGREIPGRLIPGPLSTALSGYLGRDVQLFRRDPAHLGHDDQPVTLMSEASLEALAAELAGGTAPGQPRSGPPGFDPRRFRMSITITGTGAWAEHGWAGRQLAIGEAILSVIAPVPRCVVTTRNPDSGTTDARVLHALARLRGKDDITFGVWCDVIRPGRIRTGDPVQQAAVHGRGAQARLSSAS